MNKALYKHSLYSFFIDPLFYACSAVTIFYTAFMFFFANRFFSIESGSTSLTPFFNAIAGISILTIPLLTFRIRYFINEDSIPISETRRFFTLAFSVFTVCAIPLILLSAIPVCVSFFGSVDAGQVFTGYFSLFFYFFTSILLVLFLFSAFKTSKSTLSILFSVVILFCFNFIHIIPSFLKTNDSFSLFLQKISFAWRFNSFSKGIFDSRDLAFYVLTSIILLLLCVFFKFKKTERTINKLTVFSFLLTFVFSGISLDRLYFRLDFTKDKRYSVSPVSRQLCSALDNPLRITYFRSKELKQFYPQTQDVSEYLTAFASSSKNIFFTAEKADPQKLERLNIAGRQMRSQNSTKVEYNYVYSAILLQYLDKSAIIPFVISTKTLEYDLTQRIQQLITGYERKLYVITGNDFSLEDDYSYVAPWLSARGFSVQNLPLSQITTVLDHIESSKAKDTEILLLGSSNLTLEQCQSIKNAAENGCALFAMTSPYTVNIKDEWKVSSKTNEAFLRVLNGWGISFDNSLAQDLSNFPLTLTSGEGVNTTYKTMNYPLWISVLPQNEAFEGLIVSWASPINCYLDAKPLLLTSPYAWKQNSSNDSSSPFLIDPFNLAQTAQAAGTTNQTLTLAAIIQNEKLNVAVISDQFFLSSLMTGFTSTSEQGDFRNYDWTASILLKLRGEEKIAQLMQKTSVNNSLYKIVDEISFLKAKKIVLAVNFIVLPLVILLTALAFIFIRKRRNSPKVEMQ